MDLHTLAVTAGRPDRPGQPVNPPLVLASNVRHGVRPDGPRDVPDYARGDGTETWSAFEAAIGALEGGHAVAFSSGMAAIHAAITAVGPKVVVVPRAFYGGTRTLTADLAALGVLDVRPVDITDTAAVVGALDGADLLWIESPTNPLIEIADVPALCDAAAAGGVAAAVDNTFATPVVQRPLGMGASIVLHSATKFIGGHSDLLCGVAVTTDPALAERVRGVREHYGATPGALETWLALRGLRTLPLRYERAQASASILAERLASHPAVTRVHHPSLRTDPGHARAAATMDGFGAVLAFVVDGGAEAADRVCDRVRVITPATSLGGVESTMERRSRLAGDRPVVDPGLLRLSVGIEAVHDLWADLDQALAR